MCAAAAAGGFPLFSSPYEVQKNERDRQQKRKTDQNGREVFRYPCKHHENSFPFYTSLPNLCSQTGSLPVRAEQLENNPRQEQNRGDQAGDTHGVSRRKEAAELMDHQSGHIGKAALVADGEPCPFFGVHLAFDRADGGKAGSAKQVKHQEGIPRDSGECRGQILIHGTGTAGVQNSQRPDDVLLCKKIEYNRRNSESNPSSVYNRIIDRFYKNMKDTLEK